MKMRRIGGKKLFAADRFWEEEAVGESIFGL